MKTSKQLAREILDLLGGAGNVGTATHCITRLRVTLNDEGKADLDGLKGLEGALGAQIQDGQWQVILGTKVGDVFLEFEDLLGTGDDASATAAADKGGLWG